jgi:hypothetical protein
LLLPGFQWAYEESWSMYEEWATSSDQKALEDKLAEVVRNTSTEGKVAAVEPAPASQLQQTESKLQKKKRLAEDCFVEYALHWYSVEHQWSGVLVSTCLSGVFAFV